MSTSEHEKKRRKWWLKQLKIRSKSSVKQTELEDSSHSVNQDHETDEKQIESEGGQRKRYILFVGNLSYSTTSEEIFKHFTKCGVKVKEVRLLTHKGSNESRGCCFLEFDHVKHQQNALKFDRTKLSGRTINIEVTCGGGGTGKRRMHKIRQRNEKLTNAKK